MTFAEPYSDLDLDDTELRAYFALMDVAGLLRHKVEQQLRQSADLTYVQFKVLARLGLDSPTGSLRMTELADEVVYSRSGLTYQAGQMEKSGWVERSPSPDDDRGVTLTITESGRQRLARALPGHVDVLRELLFATLSGGDVDTLATLLEPVLVHMRALPPRSASSRRR
ncbi:MarR family winged helix-turn-helix transcriptional regulator [Nocardioides mangrovi]|uniref:MarR family transcriptional regulator n=1 Tax=Nocardioides mangrovi TaxID=2874580 RepID=A0ABS7U856_9ACTN|nr:MarR family transcriptional regulator [Nocardioides mangrovi]MBZ5737156.1 MarR family transcriptional regulator [Nocardioides mangrovi]